MHRHVFAMVLACCLASASAAAQDPETRADALSQEREEKAKNLQPPETSGLERGLLALENRRLFERLLNPAQGFYPKLGSITPGAGFSMGPAYRLSGLFGGHADANAFAMVSFRKYWLLDASVSLPRLAKKRLLLDVHGRRYEYPEEQFFGLGPDSQRNDDVTFGLLNTEVGATAGYTPVKWLTISGTVDRLHPSVSASSAPGEILSLFSDETAPGVDFQPDFVRYEAALDLNYSQPKGNPRRGGRYMFTYQNYDDLEVNQYEFERFEADIQQYLPFLNDRRVIALHALASVSRSDEGREVPFYFQRTLGGPDDLRGFRRFRFRDESFVLFQAEYRWEIFTAVDGALFYDAGKVASRVRDVNFHDLESDFGFGFRFGTKNGIFLRIDSAFGSSGGTHFAIRFGNAF